MRRIARPPRTLLVALAVLAATALWIPVSGLARSDADLCQPQQAGVNCGPGKNRRSGGGGDKVPHHDGLNTSKGQRATRRWPAISGILWQVVDDGRRRRTKLGGPANDELLGHHASDVLSGAGGHDILWGDWDPVGNTSSQRDVLSGGAGNDWIYPSHGRTVIRAGPGADYVWAYYGTGSIDCGAGIDTARIRTNGAFRTRSCERIRHFCAHGENGRGSCLSPTGKPVPSSPRTR